MKNIFLVVIIFIATCNIASAYENIIVHPVINEKAATQSKLDSALINIGFQDGLREFTQGLNEKLTVLQWIAKGGLEEDEPGNNVRFHFHDPLQPWNDAGFWEPWTLGLTGSALLRAQSSSYDFTWKKARDAYYNALTTRTETEYSQTFFILGRLMHLLSDMAVPSHVREDYHFVEPGKNWYDFIEDPDLYEAWTAEKSKQLNYTGIKVDPAIFSRVVASTEAPVPISALWDQNIYNLPAPNQALTKATDPAAPFTTVGLAEYTNANFFSQDTIFQYPNPSKETVFTKSKVSIGMKTFADLTVADLETVIAEDQKPDLRLYAYATDKQGDYKLAALGYFSAALLNYFFRGDMDSLVQTNPDSGRLINCEVTC